MGIYLISNKCQYYDKTVLIVETSFKNDDMSNVLRWRHDILQQSSGT